MVSQPTINLDNAKILLLEMLSKDLHAKARCGRLPIYAAPLGGITSQIFAKIIKKPVIVVLEIHVNFFMTAATTSMDGRSIGSLSKENTGRSMFDNTKSTPMKTMITTCLLHALFVVNGSQILSRLNVDTTFVKSKSSYSIFLHFIILAMYLQQFVIIILDGSSKNSLQ